MSYLIEAIQGTTQQIEEIIQFLKHSPGEAHSEALWRQRLRYWWQDNPVASPTLPKGWLLRHDGKVAGILGCVPVPYQAQGNPLPAVAASTWRVLPEHRNQSLRLFMPLFKLSRNMLVLNTSPSDAVQAVLQRSGFQSKTTTTRHFFVIGKAASPLAARAAGRGRGFQKLDPGLHIVTDPKTIKAIAQPDEPRLCVEKSLSPEYLCWQLSTPMGDLRFVGCATEDGVLHSYMVLFRDRVKGLPAWTAVDWFTSRDTSGELIAIAGEICRQPKLLPGSPQARLLAAVSFEGDSTWDAAPSVHRRPTPAKHYYGLPDDLKGITKRCVLAEGDFLL